MSSRHWLRVVACLLLGLQSAAVIAAATPRCHGIEGVMSRGDSSWWQRGGVAVPLQPRQFPGVTSALAVDSTMVSRFTPGAAGLRRVVIWGDSHLAGGGVRDALERALARRGVTLGASFLPPYLTQRGVRLPLRAFCLGRAWRAGYAYAAQTAVDYGPALAELRAPATGSDSSLWLDLRSRAGLAEVTHARLFVRALRADSEIAITLGNGKERRIPLSFLAAPVGEGTTAQPMVIDLRPPLGLLAELRLRVTRGEVAWQGMAVERALPSAITIDVLAIPGATVDGLALATPQRLSEPLGGPTLDAFVLAYGTNEAANAFDDAAYSQRLQRALTTLRQAFPTAACLLIGAPDRGLNFLDRPSRGRPGIALTDPRHNARIHARVNAIQAEVATAFGCAAWDWQTAMGGVGAATRWQSAQPPLMAADRIHLTQDGYRASGELLADWLGWNRPPLGRDPLPLGSDAQPTAQ